MITIDKEDLGLKLYRIRIAEGTEAVSVAFRPSKVNTDGLTVVEWLVVFEKSLINKGTVTMGVVFKDDGGVWRFGVHKRDYGLMFSTLTLKAVVAFIETVLPGIDKLEAVGG